MAFDAWVTWVLPITARHNMSSPNLSLDDGAAYEYAKGKEPVSLHAALRFMLILLVVGCTSEPVPPEHHDAFVEKWLGKHRKELVREMGQPTRETKLSSGEKTLVWEKPSDCYITFNITKADVIESGYRRCPEQR